MIKVQNLTLTHPKTQVTAFQDINLQIKKGSTTVLIGPSGCGKTSLLYVLAELKQASLGNVTYNLNRPKEKLAMILQDYGLFPWKTVESNITLGMKLRGLKSFEVSSRIEDILERLQLNPYRQHYPTQLSGGQQQRVALARALVLQPQILLMDEPFSSLDALTREKAQELFLELKLAHKEMTVILVTHSIDEAVYLGDRVLVMSSSPGHIVADIYNPHQGLDNYLYKLRQSDEFLQMTNRLRACLRKTEIK